LVSYTGSRTDKSLEIAAREVAATVREAQNYALTGRDAGESGGVNCNDYIFTYTIGSAVYTIKNNCNINISYTLKNGVVFDNEGSFSFSAPHGIVSIVSTETITLSKNSKKITVCVYSSGKIMETSIGESCP